MDYNNRQIVNWFYCYQERGVHWFIYAHVPGWKMEKILFPKKKKIIIKLG